METRDDKYIQFPLCLIQQTYGNSKTESKTAWNNILCYGVVKYAKTFKYELADVGRQLMYHYYRNKNMIQDSLLKNMEDYIDKGELLTDEDYNGFQGATFDPMEFSGEGILKIFEDDQKFREDSILMYQVSQTGHPKTGGLLNLVHYDLDSILHHHERGLSYKDKFEAVHGSDAQPMIKPSMLIEFRDSGKDIDLFRAYIGIRSLIGQKTFTATYKSVILSRMLGCKTDNSLKEFTQTNKEAMEVYTRYSGRKRMDKLLFKLMEGGFIIALSKKHQRSIFVTVRYKDPAEFAEAINEQRRDHDLKKKLTEASQLI